MNMNMPSVMTHDFSRVPKADIPRSAFDRTFAHKTTFDAGYLIPVYVDEALPGDTFKMQMHAFARLATPLHPIMDNIYLNTHFFAVPYRLVWDNWQKFNGEQRNPGDSTDFLVPTMTSPVGGYLANTIYDYMGLPVAGQVDPAGAITHDSLLLRAYNLIWNEWFRDQNLQNSVVVDVGDGPDNPANYQLLRRGKRHDYFTSALPWPQKGPAVELPLSGNAPVMGIGYATASPGTATPSPSVLEATGSATVFQPYSQFNTNLYMDLTTATVGQARPAIYADLSQVAAATINSLRQAFQVQKLYERDARGGTRYTEIILAHFGVQSDDARLQRPEFLGGGQSYFNVHPVVQNSETTVDSPQGNLAAFGTASIHGHGFVKSFTEHCLLIGLVSLRADLTYQQGMRRMWSRRTRFDFYWPAFSHIGEQAVLYQEIYATGTATDDDVWGYQERSADYRYFPSMVTAEYRSSFAQSLDVWHLSQDLVNPQLNAEFIEEDPPLDRVIAVPSEPHVLFDGYFKLHCARPMPVYSVPGLIDHF